MTLFRQRREPGVKIPEECVVSDEQHGCAGTVDPRKRRLDLCGGARRHPLHFQT
jgi:hypothetical protein